MSDETSKPFVPEEFLTVADLDLTTHSQFTRFLEAMAPEKPCPECGVNEWGTSIALGETGKPDPKLQLATVPGFLTPGVFSMHTLHCMNCGFTKFFAASIVDKWVNDNA